MPETVLRGGITVTVIVALAQLVGFSFSQIRYGMA